MLFLLSFLAVSGHGNSFPDLLSLVTFFFATFFFIAINLKTLLLQFPVQTGNVQDTVFRVLLLYRVDLLFSSGLKLITDNFRKI